MKFNIRWEYSPEEYAAMADVVKTSIKKFTKLVKIAQENEHQRRLIQLRKDRNIKKHTFIVDDGDEESEDDFTEEELWEPPTSRPEPIPFKVHQREEPKEAEIDPAKVEKIEKGQEIFKGLVALWLQNFDVEGDQPNRPEEMRQFSITKKGLRVMAYLHTTTGLTIAVKDNWPDGVELDLDKVRKVAENMTQVGSLLFPPICALLEYPNPLEE